MSVCVCVCVLQAQRQQDLPCVGQRGGPPEGHQHAEGRQHEGGFHSLLYRTDQGEAPPTPFLFHCVAVFTLLNLPLPRADRKPVQGARPRVHVERALGLRAHLSVQPGHRAAGWRARQAAQPQQARQVRRGAQAAAAAEERHR